MNNWSGLPSTAPRTMGVGLVDACVHHHHVHVVCCPMCTLCIDFETGWVVQGRLSFGASPWSALEECSLGCALQSKRVPACMRADLMHICCVQHRCVLHVAVKRHWGILGAESVADLFHHAPVLQEVDILCETHGCVHATLYSHASLFPPCLCPTSLAFVFLFLAHTPPPCVHPPFIFQTATLVKPGGVSFSMPSPLPHTFPSKCKD